MATKTATTRTKTAKARPASAKKAAGGQPAAGKQTWKSRAVLRLVEPGSMVDCSHCGDRVKFQAKMRNQQVICNVYVKGVWDRVEHFHADCYGAAEEPFGPPDENQPKK